jgi:hypothetical protein
MAVLGSAQDHRQPADDAGAKDAAPTPADQPILDFKTLMGF